MQRVQDPQRSGGGCVRLDFERRQQLAQKEPRSLALIDQAGVLPDPAQPGRARVGSLEQRGRVHANARFVKSGRVRALAQHPIQSLQTLPHHIVIVFAPRIARDPSTVRFVEGSGVRRRRVVNLPHADHRSRRRQQLPRIVAQRSAVIAQIAHLAGESRGDPIGVAREIRRGRRAGYARQFESAGARDFANGIARHTASPIKPLVLRCASVRWHCSCALRPAASDNRSGFRRSPRSPRSVRWRLARPTRRRCPPAPDRGW